MRPSRDETCMKMARLAAERSTCSRGQVGAIIAIDGRTLSTGYNGAPAGMPHCDHSCTCSETFNYAMATDPDLDPDEHEPTCWYTRPCQVTIHAEANAIAFAARHGVAIEGAEMFVTLSPCLMCAKLLINAGITRVWVDEMYRDPSGLELLEKAGIITATLG